LRWLVSLGGDEAHVGEGVEDESCGGFDGAVVVGVEADDLGLGGEVGAGLALDEAEDEQGQADDADQGGDAPVVLQVERRDGERAFEVAVAAFCDGLALVVVKDLGRCWPG
jgi:hypothetical protein